MIKKLIAIFFLMALPLLVNAQKDEFKPGWEVGIGFGPTFSSMDFQSFMPNAWTKINTKSLQQYAGGVAVRYISEKNLGFIVELNYSQQGWQQDFVSKDNPLANMGFEHIHKLNYLEMPILTHIYFGNKVRFVVNLGPKISYLLNDSESINQSLSDYLSSGNADGGFETYQYYRLADRKIDYGLMGGMGLEFRTGIGNFLLEGRYTFSLGDIYKNSKADHFSRSANRVISAKLTYYIKLF